MALFGLTLTRCSLKGKRASASSSWANFLGFEETGLLPIGDVIHEAFVAVDEEGTETAAATGIPLVGSAPWEIVVDRPFVFLIWDPGTGTILFLGRVVDPRGLPSPTENRLPVHKLGPFSEFLSFGKGQDGGYPF